MTRNSIHQPASLCTFPGSAWCVEPPGVAEKRRPLLLAPEYLGAQSHFTLPAPCRVGPASHPDLPVGNQGALGETVHPGSHNEGAEVGVQTEAPWVLQPVPEPCEDTKRLTESGGRKRIPPAPAPGPSTWQPVPTCDNSVNTDTGATAGPYPNPDVEETVSPKILTL